MSLGAGARRQPNCSPAFLTSGRAKQNFIDVIQIQSPVCELLTSLFGGTA